MKCGDKINLECTVVGGRGPVLFVQLPDGQRVNLKTSTYGEFEAPTRRLFTRDPEPVGAVPKAAKKG